MARIRTIKPESWQDPRVGRVSVPARLLWVVTLTMADDEGRFNALPTVILGHGYPYDADALQAIPGLLGELSGAGMLVLYEVDGVPYGWHPKWSVHQVINRPSASRLPAPPEPSRQPHGEPVERSSPDQDQGSRIKEGIKDQSAGAVIVVPPPAAVSEEADKVCDTLAAAGLNVHDRTAMEKLLGEFPDVDPVEAAISCANWARGKRARHPLPTLRKFLEADDAKQRRVVDPALAAYANVGVVDDGSGS